MVEIINGLGLFCGGLLESLMRSTWQGSILILMVFAVTQLWRRGPACAKYALWMLVIVKFLVPFQIYLPTGQVNPLTHIPTPFFNPSVINPSAFAETAAPAAVYNSAGYQPHLDPWTIWQICGAVWILASGLILTMGILRYWRMRRLLVRSCSEPDQSFQAHIDELKSRVGCRQSIIVLESEAIDSPLVTGLFRPLMILPGQLFASLEPNEQRTIIIHELCHLKRRDHLVMWLEHVVFALQFFNPLLWLALRRLRSERERACDDRVVDLLNGCTVNYGGALLKVLQYRQDHTRIIPNALALTEGRHETAQRIRRILTPSRRIVARISIPAILILIVLAIALVSSRAAKDQVSLSTGDENATLIPNNPSYILDSKAYDHFMAEVSQSAGKSKEMARNQSNLFDGKVFEQWQALASWCNEAKLLGPLSSLKTCSWGPNAWGPLRAKQPSGDPGGMQYIGDVKLQTASMLLEANVLDIDYLSNRLEAIGPGLKIHMGEIEGKAHHLLYDKASETLILEGKAEVRQTISGHLEEVRAWTMGGPDHIEIRLNPNGFLKYKLEFYQIDTIRSLAQFRNRLEKKDTEKVEYLELAAEPVTKDDLRNLGSYRNLKSLDLSDTPVNDADLAHLKSLKKMQRLNLAATLTKTQHKPAITDEGLKHLAKIESLEIMTLHGLPITDAGLECLKEMPKLRSLQLGGTQVTGEGLRYLPNLTWIRLDSTPVTDEALRHVCAMKNLEQLYLDGTKISDAALQYLTALPRLRVLNIHNTRVTDEGVQKLQKALPNLSIGR